MADFDQAPLRPGLPQNYARSVPSSSGPSSLADILERVLDKGIVIAGDIQINLLDIELLTIKLRLLIASVDRAQEMGINWWESDSSLSPGAEDLENENRELRERVERLERAIGPGEGDADGDGDGQAAQGYGDRGKTRGARR
jgi:Gas vesicle protein